jgi:hypothetical protein
LDVTDAIVVRPYATDDYEQHVRGTAFSIDRSRRTQLVELSMLSERRYAAYSVEKRLVRIFPENVNAGESLKFERAERAAIFDDISPRSIVVHAQGARLSQVFSHKMIYLKNSRCARKELSGRPRDLSAGAPTDPDVQDSRIRLFDSSSR